jgi:hypothetical protein
MWKLWRTEIKGGIHVCGCGHSGTSILTRLIGAHSEIYALPGETGIAKKERYSIYRSNVELFEQEAIRHNASCWVEKTPKHVRNLRFILDCAPDAKIILIIRNPKDTVASLKRRYGSLSKSIRRWKLDNKRVMHWSTHPQCIMIQYENLITRTESTLAQVMEFLGKTFEPEQLNFHSHQVTWYKAAQNPPLDGDGSNFDGQENPAKTDLNFNGALAMPEVLDESKYGSEMHHNTYRNYQINQPLFNNIGSHRKYLNDAEIDRISQACRSLALALCYDDIDASSS